MAIRLMVIDDHELVRAGMVQFLESFPDIEIVAEASSGDDLLEKLSSIHVDLLLLDMSMPGWEGANLIRHIRAIHPEILIMVVSMHDETQTVLGAIKAGASGYICKSCSPSALYAAIKKIVATGKYLSPSMAEQLAYASTFPDSSTAGSLLTDREMEILRLVVEGKSVNDIARRLFISNKTVSTHKHNMLCKLELNGIADLVRYAIEHKLLT